MRETYNRSKEMLAQSREILTKLGDHYLVRLVDITELRVEQYFRKELKME